MSGRLMLGAAVVVDSRGGGLGTVNTDPLRLGYSRPHLDAIVFAGGSSYGEEAVTAVATGLKDEGARTGASEDIAFTTGATIYDFGGRRLNEVYPDKRLAEAALGAGWRRRLSQKGRIPRHPKRGSQNTL